MIKFACTASALILLSAAPAMAQDAADEVDANEIVVTAQKRTENLQNVPISIQAIGTQKLDDLNISNFSNYAQQLWYQQLPATVYHRSVVLRPARHEIFMETDSIRQQAFAAINDFLAQLPD